MRILLIGNFAPPYEEESLHNLSLLNMLKEEGNDCCVINISENLPKEEEFVDSKNFFDFVFKLIRCGWKRDVIHFLTKGYARPGLIKFIVATFVGRFYRAKPILTIHSEMFTIINRTRSYLLGTPALRISFSLAHRVICGDKDTYEVAAAYKTKNNFELIPSFIHIPENIKENESLALKKLTNKKKVIVFSNIIYPSFVFEVLNNLVAKYLNSDLGIAVSLSGGNSEKLKQVIKETGYKVADNIIFIEPSDKQLLSMTYSIANFVIKPLSCDGKISYPSFVISIRKPVRSANFLYFPISLLFVKEGETADLCAYILNNLLMKRTEEPPEPTTEDFYSKIKEIYSK